ncbi:MAG: DNA repair protein RadA [Microthrixaceae bacterium]|nr:DNA repair protein RadA [Microthrixaceae bacterium]
MTTAAITSRSRSRFRCLACGDVSLKWAGRCGGCGEWNTLEADSATVGCDSARATALAPASPARPICEVPVEAAEPVPTGIAELDRVLCGGLVRGSVTLMGGEPGVGKSTLLLQVAGSLAEAGLRVLYVTAEESAQQVRGRAERLGAVSDQLYLAAETSLPHLLGHIDAVEPSVVIVDSVQTVHDPSTPSAAGSVAQVRGVTSALVRLAKEADVTVLLVGHVTKDGALAGPRVLEHIVDTVVSFEGDRHHSLRLVRATKHRFGSTQEVGLFSLGEAGLDPVADPSGVFLADRRSGEPGSVVVPTLEGRRPLLVELQALVASTSATHPHRSSHGVDAARVSLLLAVLGRRLEVPVLGSDVYVMAVGGAKVVEPGADLPIALAVASSVTNQALPFDMVACGEVGLGGELRAVTGFDRRLSEAARMGFSRAIVPTSTPAVDASIRLCRVDSLHEALLFLDRETPVGR